LLRPFPIFLLKCVHRALELGLIHPSINSASRAPWVDSLGLQPGPQDSVWLLSFTTRLSSDQKSQVLQTHCPATRDHRAHLALRVPDTHICPVCGVLSLVQSHTVLETAVMSYIPLFLSQKLRMTQERLPHVKTHGNTSSLW
jgi:hypothetical protein